jgi:aminotransferase
MFLPYLRQAGFDFSEPEGAYYVMTDITPLGGTDDTAFVRQMIQEIGVSAVPGSSFYSPRERGRTKVRFMFAKRDESLHEAGRRLQRLKR